MVISIRNRRGILTTTPNFLKVTTLSHDNKTLLLSYDDFEKFIPQMRGEWQVSVGTSLGNDYQGEEIVGKFGFTWNNIVSGKYRNLDFCYLKAESKRGDRILCQIFG